MSIKRYIEADENEKWSDLSRSFAEWFTENTDVKNFGFHEGDCTIIMPEGLTFFIFEFPDKYRELIIYFDNWAKASNRKSGYREHGRLWLTDNESIQLNTCRINKTFQTDQP